MMSSFNFRLFTFLFIVIIYNMIQKYAKTQIVLVSRSTAFQDIWRVRTVSMLYIRVQQAGFNKTKQNILGGSTASGADSTFCAIKPLLTLK